MVQDGAGGGSTRRDRLAQRRKALGLTQETLASLLGVERTTVTRWEQGERAPLPWLRPKLARTLHVSVDRLEELLGGRGPGGSPRSVGAPAAPSDSTGPVPRQLPPAIADFTGREAELAALTRVADDADVGAPGTVVVSAIGGTAGVGKTALAVHWAHLVAGRFGDGQLYVNLRGFDPSGTPVTPAEALRGFLEALGVRPDRIPSAVEAQAGLYRGMLANRKMLIVLDNALDEQQIRPLLPASPGSLVIVISRNQLSGLAAADGARLLTLDVLSHCEAVRLLTARVGHARAAAEPEAIADIATLCACLPLALTIAAARTAARPCFSLTGLAAELRDASDRLDALDAGSPTASVRAVFSWSYRHLGAGAARMFRLLGLHAGPDISAPAAASLAATDEPTARRLLRELARAHLTTEQTPGRYALHDLLRVYAADQARDSDSETERATVTARALDHYLHTAAAVATVIHPSREPMNLAPLSPGATPESVADYRQAMAWFQAEHAVLLAAVAQAAGSGFDRHAWQLPHAMAEYLERRGHWHERIAVLGTGLAASIRLGDPAGEAASRRLLGHAYYRVGDYVRADAHLRHSARLHRRLGDCRGEAKAHTVLASLAERQGRYADAIGHLEQALRLFQDAGHQAGEAEILNNIGWYHALLGDYQQARVYCRQSLALSAEHGDRHTAGHAWDSLGYAEHHLGNLSEAVACYERALAIFREFGHRYFEAATLSNLGDAWHAGDDLQQAREAWQEAFAIFDDLQHADATKVGAKLAGIAPE